MATEKSQVVQLWFDGYCPGNGISDDDRAGYGLVFRTKDQDHHRQEKAQIEYGSDVTGPVAQYKALINGLQRIQDVYGGERPLQVNAYSDAESVILQVTGDYAVNETHLRGLRWEARDLLDEFEDWNLEYVSEEKSGELKRADGLAADAVYSDEDQEGESE